MMLIDDNDDARQGHVCVHGEGRDDDNVCVINDPPITARRESGLPWVGIKKQEFIVYRKKEWGMDVREVNCVGWKLIWLLA